MADIFGPDAYVTSEVYPSVMLPDGTAVALNLYPSPFPYVPPSGCQPCPQISCVPSMQVCPQCPDVVGPPGGICPDVSCSPCDCPVQPCEACTLPQLPASMQGWTPLLIAAGVGWLLGRG